MLYGVGVGVGVYYGYDVEPIGHVDIVFACIPVGGHANVLYLAFVDGIFWFLEHVVASCLYFYEDDFDVVGCDDVNFVSTMEPPIPMKDSVVVAHQISGGQVLA